MKDMPHHIDLISETSLFNLPHDRIPRSKESELSRTQKGVNFVEKSNKKNKATTDKKR